MRDDVHRQKLSKTDQHQHIRAQRDSPVLHSTERLLVGDVVHEDEAHGPTVVGSGDGPVALLACCVLQIDKMI